jgi:DNA polymerase
MHPLQKTLFYDDIAVVDFETFWAQDFTLQSKTQSMTEYIRSPRFEAQTCAVQLWGQAEPQVAVGGDEIYELLHDACDWRRTAWCSHHTHFDGLISTEHFDVTPVFWMDTMSISKAVYGPDVNHSFNALSARLGLKGKVKGDILKATKGKYLRDMSPDDIALLCEYNYDDCSDTLLILKKTIDYLPFEELRIIDATIRMYCEPLLELDEARLKGLHGREVERRAQLIVDAETSADVLGSAPKFADLLRSLGVVPPMKRSPRTGLPTYAFAKTDLEFKALLEHPNETVRAAVLARLGNKGSIVETRSKRLLARVGLPTPVYLAYAAARTLRWGGGDLSNWQNLPSTGDGANLRKAILAPAGCKIIGADASQVEARMVAFLAEFKSKIEAFLAYDAGTGPDAYCVSAEGVYGRPIDAKRDLFERFIGKVLELSCQYGAGAVRVKHSLAQGFRGAAPVYMDLLEVKANITRWRRANQAICDLWSVLEQSAKRAWLQDQEVTVGPVIFERFKADGYIHLPNGTYIKYTNVGWDDEKRSLFYNSRNGVVHLWGGHLLENVSQALCAALLKWQMVQMMDAMPWLRIALLVHDEVVSVASNETALEYADQIKAIMSTPAPWAVGMPLNAAVKIGDYYDKA